MYAGGRDRFDSGWHELRVLDRLLAQLTRPVPAGEALPDGLNQQLLDLGVMLGGAPQREDLVAEVWGRKRPLIRNLDTFDDPLPPCA